MKGHIPLITIASTAAGAPISLPFGDIALDVSRGQSNEVQTSGVFKNSMVIGLELRIIYKKLWKEELKLSRKQPSTRTGRQLDNSDDQDTGALQGDKIGGLTEDEFDLGDAP